MELDSNQDWKQSGLKVLNGHETAAMRRTTTTTTKRDNGKDNNSQDNHQINTNNMGIESFSKTPSTFSCRKSSKDEDRKLPIVNACWYRVPGIGEIDRQCRRLRSYVNTNLRYGNVSTTITTVMGQTHRTLNPLRGHLNRNTRCAACSLFTVCF